MMAYPDEETEGRARLFFEYWRIRVGFIRTLNEAHWHEANVLLYSHLDALSNHWHTATQRPKTPARVRFGDYLADCGNVEAFKRVSAPDIWSRAERGDMGLPPSFATMVASCAGRSRGTPLQLRMEGMRDMLEDPTLPALLGGELQAISAEKWSIKKSTTITIEEWLRRSRVGEFAYEWFRCSWIHEGRPGQLHTDSISSRSTVVPQSKKQLGGQDGVSGSLHDGGSGKLDQQLRSRNREAWYRPLPGNVSIRALDHKGTCFDPRPPRCRHGPNAMTANARSVGKTA